MRVKRSNVKRHFETTVCPDERYRSEFESWRAMWIRCTYPSQKYFYNYGGRGIVPCDSWKSFETFLHDLGEKPEPKKLYSIERKNNDLGYCADNCKWATRKEQATNRRSQVKTHCVRNHPLIPENLKPYALARGIRACVECRRIADRARYAEKKEKLLGIEECTKQINSQ